MLWLITATNADGSYRQWAERIPEFVQPNPMAVTWFIRSWRTDQHRDNRGHGNQRVGAPLNIDNTYPTYAARPL